jgi:putative oxidoreductase
MRIVGLMARRLLGIIFVVFGSDLWFHFIPMNALPPGPASQFLSALFVTHDIQVVAFFQGIPGLLLLINRYIALALALLVPVIFNIDLTHLLMAPSGLPLASFVTWLWILVFSRVRTAFHPLFEAKIGG